MLVQAEWHFSNHVPVLKSLETYPTNTYRPTHPRWGLMISLRKSSHVHYWEVLCALACILPVTKIRLDRYDGVPLSEGFSRALNHPTSIAKDLSVEKRSVTNWCVLLELFFTVQLIVRMTRSCIHAHMNLRLHLAISLKLLTWKSLGWTELFISVSSFWS